MTRGQIAQTADYQPRRPLDLPPRERVRVEAFELVCLTIAAIVALAMVLR